MTVGQLIVTLAAHPADAEVVIDKADSSPLGRVRAQTYVAETAWSGSLIHDEDARPGVGVRAVVLVPVN